MLKSGWRLAMVAASFAAALGVPWGSAEARYAAMVVDAQSGAVLYARRPDIPRYPASLTKMMTLYLAFEALEAGRLRLERKLPVSKRAAGQAPSRLGLKAGQSITVRDAVLALITKSANDAATVLAEAISGSESKFGVRMTKRARALGMTRTRFTNASGLYNRRQVTTARDMVTLAIALQRDFPQYYPYFATRSFRYGKRTYRNHNRLLERYAGTDGIKTGYIRASGFNLVASVERDGQRLVGVIFGGRSTRSRDREMVKLLDQGFGTLRVRKKRSAANLPPLPTRKPQSPPPAAVGLAAAPAPPATPTAPVAAHVTAVIETPAEAGSAEPGPLAGEDWSIQVGAFRRLASAERQAEAAVRVAPGPLGDAGVSILAVHDAERTLYRARLVGLSEHAARDACGLLKRKRIGCTLVAPGEALTLASAHR